ncbi:MAG: dipeptidase, partial [bacterium]|nr:dipeptidase [bacterium]
MCTTMILTRGALADRSMLVAHSDDDELGDQRIIYVPRRKQPERQVLKGSTAYPRLVTDRRGPGYEMPDHPKSEVLGTIPNPHQPYAYFDGNYGIANEYNLMMGECTNAAKYQPDAVSEEDAT